MGKVLGIIVEYNPFHNGHLYHLQESKKQTGSTYTVAIMSGNFTQRGSTSIIDKWSKAEIALYCGVDLVIELPVLYSISSAENFADGAIKILDSLKVVDYLSFGAETADIPTLQQIAEVLYTEPRKYKTFLSHELRKGLSFPKARENALMMYLNDIRRFIRKKPFITLTILEPEYPLNEISKISVKELKDRIYNKMNRERMKKVYNEEVENNIRMQEYM